MQNIKSLLTTVIHSRKLPYYFAGIGLALYIAQTILFTQIRIPNMDEGAYLFKGLQYARGSSVPFEPYSFWTNKMYLTFYLYGWIQLLFGPGLLVSRFFSATLGVFSVIGIWLMARRFSNNWIAAASVWAMALNSTMISIYSIGNSQVVVIFFLVWSLAFSLGEGRKNWEIFLGAALAAIMVLCRENMIFVPPLLAVYSFWQHGRRKGFITLITSGTILLIGHLIFWPEILYLWGKWLPFISQSDNTFTRVAGLESLPSSFYTRLHSLALSIRVFALPLTVIFVALILWVKKSAWKTGAYFKTAVFLVTILIILIGSHTWASIGNDYCVYCTTNYYAFFMPIGLVLFAVSYASFSFKRSVSRLIPLLFIIPAIGTLIGFSFFEKIGYTLMKIAVPRMSDGGLLPGTVELWQLLANKFQVDYESSRMLLPGVLGLAISITFLLLIWIIYRKTRAKNKVSYTYYCCLAVLITCLVLSPMLTWPTQETFSKVSVPNAFKKIGEALAQSTAPGDKVYIDGGTTAVPLLYVDDIVYLPAQINVKFSYVNDIDSNLVAQSGLWNRQIAQDWRKQSVVFLIEQSEMANWVEYIQSENLISVPINIDYSNMPQESRIFLFIKP